MFLVILGYYEVLNTNKKHAAFGKYKGRINNYLSKRGYDLVKERKAWYERIKARGGKI